MGQQKDAKHLKLRYWTTALALQNVFHALFPTSNRIEMAWVARGWSCSASRASFAACFAAACSRARSCAARSCASRSAARAACTTTVSSRRAAATWRGGARGQLGLCRSRAPKNLGNNLLSAEQSKN